MCIVFYHSLEKIMIASQHVIILIFFVSLLKNTTPHDHGHSHEPPHLKYTREVNEAVSHFYFFIN